MANTVSSQTFSARSHSHHSDSRARRTVEYRLPAVAGSHTLPVPSPEGMIRFQRLYEEKFGVQLDSQVALSLATRYLHFIYFGITQPPTTPAAEQENKSSGSSL